MVSKFSGVRGLVKASWFILSNLDGAVDRGHMDFAKPEKPEIYKKFTRFQSTQEAIN